MVSTLKEVADMQKELSRLRDEGQRVPYRINVIKEVRYFADMDGSRYALCTDWETQDVTEFIDEYFSKKKRK